MRPKPSRYELGLLASMVLLLALSAIHPHDYFTWWLEVAPILIGVPVLIWLYPSLRLTPLTYTLIWLHCLILMLGGHYTYAQVPLGFWMEHAFGFARNHYDRIGHFAQGFIPAMLAREILIRRSPLAGSRWLPFFVVCFCLAFSALYELIESGPRSWLAARPRIPGDPGRRVGHAVGHAARADRSHHLPGYPLAGSGPPARADGSSSPFPRRPLNLVDATRSRRSPVRGALPKRKNSRRASLAGSAPPAKRVQPTALLVPNTGRVCRVRRSSGPISADWRPFRPS